MTIALIVEDGTGGVADANSYVSQAGADAYFADRANASWAAAASDAKAAVLIQATQYLDARYTFKGQPLLDTQPLAWPRQAQVYSAPVMIGYQTQVYAGSASDAALFAWPVKRLIQACCEAALRALTGSLYTDEDSAIVTSEKVDVIEVHYADRARNGGQVRIAIVDDLLKPLLNGGRYNVPLVRA